MMYGAAKGCCHIWRLTEKQERIEGSGGVGERTDEEERKKNAHKDPASSKKRKEEKKQEKKEQEIDVCGEAGKLKKQNK